MPSMRGGCGSAHTGSLCISIIILIIVIILIVMVCCNYNYNNYNYNNYNYGNYNYDNYNKTPPPRIQNPRAAAAVAYKYGKNGGMNGINGGMNRFTNVPYNPWGTCENKPNCAACSMVGIGGVCINSKCYSNPSIVESCNNTPANKNNFNNGGNSCDNKPAGATCYTPIGEGAEANGTCYNGNCATLMCKNKANGDSCLNDALAHASCVNSACRSVKDNDLEA